MALTRTCQLAGGGRETNLRHALGAKRRKRRALLRVSKATDLLQNL